MYLLNLFVWLLFCVLVICVGERLSSSHKEQRGGRYCGACQEENGAWPFGHSEDGHKWSDCTGRVRI